MNGKIIPLCELDGTIGSCQQAAADRYGSDRTRHGVPLLNVTMPSGVEIERKFLVDHAPSDLAAHPSGEIDQGYLAVADDGVEVRIRRYGSQAFLTIKAGGGQTRLEEELEIDERTFRSLWTLTEGRRIQKTRYLMPAPDGRRIELDVYHGALAGLITAEVEFDSPDAAAAFNPPPWLGREVTDDPRYKNRRLAVGGLPA